MIRLSRSEERFKYGTFKAHKDKRKRKNSYKNGYAILRTYTQHKKALTACKLPPS